MTTISFANAASTVTLDLPTDNFFSSENRIDFNYTVIGTNVTWNTTLFHNESGTFEFNRSINDTANNTASNFTLVNLPDGTYIWNIRAENGSVSNFSSANFTVTVDTTSPTCAYTTTTPTDNAEFDEGVTVTIAIDLTEANMARQTCNLIWKGTNESIDKVGEVCSTTKVLIADADYYFEGITDQAGNTCASTARRYLKTQNPSGVGSSSGTGIPGVVTDPGQAFSIGQQSNPVSNAVSAITAAISNFIAMVASWFS